jgi:hypothetical protein
MYNNNARDELSSETVMIMYIILYKCLSTIKGNITINITEKNAGPDVQQLPGGGARRHILFVFFQCILLGLSYLTLCPYHFIYILFLGPCILFHFLRGWGSTPCHYTGIIKYLQISWESWRFPRLPQGAEQLPEGARLA